MMAARADRKLELTAELDCTAVHKHSKPDAYDAHMERLKKKLKKPKKKPIMVRIYDKELEMAPLQKTEIKRIQYDKILKLISTPKSQNTLIIAQKGTGKVPVWIVGLRFRKQADYERALEVILSKPEQLISVKSLSSSSSSDSSSVERIVTNVPSIYSSLSSITTSSSSLSVKKKKKPKKKAKRPKSHCPYIDTEAILRKLEDPCNSSCFSSDLDGCEFRPKWFRAGSTCCGHWISSCDLNNYSDPSCGKCCLTDKKDFQICPNKEMDNDITQKLLSNCFMSCNAVPISRSARMRYPSYQPGTIFGRRTRSAYRCSDDSSYDSC